MTNEEEKTNVRKDEINPEKGRKRLTNIFFLKSSLVISAATKFSFEILLFRYRQVFFYPLFWLS